MPRFVEKHILQPAPTLFESLATLADGGDASWHLARPGECVRAAARRSNEGAPTLRLGGHGERRLGAAEPAALDRSHARSYADGEHLGSCGHLCVMPCVGGSGFSLHAGIGLPPSQPGGRWRRLVNGALKARQFPGCCLDKPTWRYLTSVRRFSCICRFPLGFLSRLGVFESSTTSARSAWRCCDAHLRSVCVRPIGVLLRRVLRIEMLTVSSRVSRERSVLLMSRCKARIFLTVM